jgi:hypothetical protein
VIAPSIDPETGELTLTYQPDAYGTVELTVRATDTGGLYAENTFVVDVESVNDAPVIGTLVDAPDPTIAGAAMVLEATGVDDDGMVVSVDFYRDADHDGLLDPETDELLANDTAPADGWSVTFNTSSLATGTQTYFAVATDDEDTASTAAVATVVTDKYAVLDDSLVAYCYCTEAGEFGIRRACA